MKRTIGVETRLIDCPRVFLRAGGALAQPHNGHKSRQESSKNKILKLEAAMLPRDTAFSELSLIGKTRAGLVIVSCIVSGFPEHTYSEFSECGQGQESLI